MSLAISVHALCGERPRSAARGEEREPVVRWSVMLGSVESLYDLIRSEQH